MVLFHRIEQCYSSKNPGVRGSESDLYSDVSRRSFCLVSEINEISITAVVCQSTVCAAKINYSADVDQPLIKGL